MQYGKPEINAIIAIIKKANGGLIDGTQKEQRNYGNLLFTKLKTIDRVKNGELSAESVLEKILEIVGQNPYYAPYITSTEKVYRNLAKLIQVCRTEFITPKQNKI